MGGGIGEEWARIPKENVEKAFILISEHAITLFNKL